MGTAIKGGNQVQKINWRNVRKLTILEILVVAVVLFVMVMIFSTNACKRQVERPAWEPPPMPSAWECRTVVGDESQSLTRVQKCWDPDTDTCWYIATSRPGGSLKMVETKCWVHPFREVNQ